MALGVIQLLFGVTDVTSQLMYSVRWQKNVNQRWTASFVLLDASGTGANKPSVGQSFTLNEDGTARFVGFIDTIDTIEYSGPPSNYLQYACTCSSWASVCDREIVTATYPTGRDALSIIQDVVANNLAGDGITLGAFSALAFIQQPLVFDGDTVSQAFQKIADLIGMTWWVDENKQLFFEMVGTGSTSSWSVTNTSGEYIEGSLKVTRTSKDFRNVQYVRAGAALSTQSKTETKTVASNLDWWFITQFPMTNVAPTVSVNGVPQHVFERGVDSNFQNGWYWQAGVFGVQQGQQIAPAIGSVIQVTYDATSSNLTSVSDTASIAARAAIEGTSGRWGNVIEAQDIQSFAIAQQLASGLLSKGSTIPDVIILDTFRSDYTIGLVVPFNLTLHGLNANYTVQSIAANELSKDTNITGIGAFRYTITLSNQINIGDYVKWFEQLWASIKTANSTSGSSVVNPPTTSSGGTPTQGAWFAEMPIGTYDGANTSFTLSYTPNPQFVLWLFLNGIFQHPTIDFSLSGNAITFTVAPKLADTAWAIYLRAAPGSSTGTPGGAQARQFGSPTSTSPGSGGYADASGTFQLPNSSSTVGFGAVNPGDTVTIGSVTYTFRATPSSANDISAVTVNGAVPAQCLANAINGGYGAGTLYGAGTTANPDASASYSSTGGLTVAAKQSPSVNPIALSASTGAITFTPASISPGNMTNGDTITVGGKTYTFVTALNNATPNQILTQAPAAFPSLTVQAMLADAINNGPAGSGTWYSSATAANANVQAVADDLNNKIIATALVSGSAGNSIVVSASAGARFGDGAGHWDGGATTLSGGTGGGTGGGGGTSTDSVDWGTNDALYRITGDLSIAMWVKLPSNASGSLIQYGGTSGSISPTNADPYGLTVQGSSGAWDILYVHDSVSPNSNQSHTFAAGIPNDTWVFVAIVRNNGASQVTLYTAFFGDTALTSIGTFTYTHPPGGTSSNGEGLLVGNRHDSSTSFGLGPFIGVIEEHYIWKRTLTTAELLAAMQRNAPLNGLALGCLMGDTPEVDMSGNGGSGAVTGTALVQGHGGA